MRVVNHSRTAFTIIELLMVLAVIGVVVGLFVFNIENAISGVNRLSPTETLLKAFRKARLVAVSEKKAVEVGYNSDIHAFELRTMGDTQELLTSFPLHESDHELIEDFHFWPVNPLDTKAANRQYLNWEKSESEIDAVEFEPFGCSRFVVVQIEYEDDGIEEAEFMIDPFSSAILADSENAEF